MDYYGYLRKYGVRFELKHIGYTPWPGRNGQKLTRICVHTEGVPPDNQIPGTADRDVFGYFNNQANGANAHGYITFSGLFIEYIPIEHGSWSVGNPDDNVQCYSVETQDNGRFGDPATYTQAQYDTWARVVCAAVEYAKEHYGTDIKFAHDNWGLIRHNDRVADRACPGALDVSRIASMAQTIYNQVNGDNLYRVRKDGKQLNAYKGRDNAFNFWYSIGGEVIYNGLNITEEFRTMAVELETKLKMSEEEKAKLAEHLGEVQDELKSVKEASIQNSQQNMETIRELRERQQTYEAFERSLFFKFYKVATSWIASKMRPKA